LAVGSWQFVAMVNRLVLKTVVWLLWTAGVANGCGVGVHLTVASRSQQFVPDDVSDLDTFARAGAFFPDAFYSCMGLSDAAEDAHWPPFLKIAVDYWHDKYQRQRLDEDIDGPRSFLQTLLGWNSRKPLDTHQSAQALKSFIYGMLTHQVADVSWHSLGVHQGLLAMIANREFDGDKSEAHNILDTGGDMIFVRRLLQSGVDLSWIRDEWQYPTKDIVEIFRLAGYKVTSGELDYCMFRGRAAIEAEIRVAQTGFVPYAQRSPLLFDKVESYYLGGMTEILMATRHCMYGLNRWFEHGTDADPWSICEVFEGMKHSRSTCKGGCLNRSLEEPLQIQSAAPKLATVARTRLAPKQSTTIITTGVNQGMFGSALAVGKFLDDKQYLAVSAPFESVDGLTNGQIEQIPRGSVYLIELTDMYESTSNEREHIVQITDPVRILGEHSFEKASYGDESLENATYQYNERFGAVLATINILGCDVLVVSQPGSSRLNFFFKHRNVLNVYWNLARIEYGGVGLKLVGESLAVGDVNGDGIDDLIIGAPYTDINGKPQSGEVYVINGVDLQDILSVALASKTPTDVNILDIVDKILQLPETHGRGYSLFGSKTAVVSRSNTRYLLVGAEGIGKVYAFDAMKDYEHVFVLQGDESSRSDFGGKLLVGTDDGWIAVGSTAEDLYSPRTGRLKCMQCGAVYLYRLQDYGETLLNPVGRKESPGSSFSRFGYEGTVAGNKLFVSSPYARSEGGQVWSLDLMDSDGDFKTVIDNGPWPYSNGFGGSLLAIEDDGKIVLVSGMPYYGLKEQDLLQGAVAIYPDI
jgi:glycosylphosphatidylinositol phospholipase D